MLRIIALFGIALVLSGCGIFGSDDSGPKPAKLVSFKAETKVKKLWSRSIGDGQEEQFLKLQPAVYSDKVFAADVNGRVAAYSAEGGKRVWQKKLKVPITGGVGAGFDLVFVGTSEGEVIALRAEDGAEAWRAQVSSEILSAPQTNGSVVVVRTLDEKAYGFDHDTGEQRWLFESILPSLTLRGTADPVVSTAATALGLANGKLVLVDTDTGRTIWEQRVSIPKGKSELERMVDVDSRPLILGDQIIAAGFQGRVAAFELPTARTRWFKELSTFRNMDEGFGNIYIVEDGDQVTALDASTGKTVWVQTDLSYRELSSPVTFGNYVVVGDADGYLHFLSQVDGRFIARKKVGGDGVRSPMVADGSTLYVFANSGKLLALSAD